MDKEYHRQYSREYRSEGFARENDKEYYKRHADRLRAIKRERMRVRRAKSKGLL